MSALNCSFTGHRTIKEAHRARLPSLLARAVEYAYNEGCRSYFCGGAIGFDTYAAREVLRFRLSHPDARLILLLPCISQADGWEKRNRDVYDYILSEADETVYISDEYTPSCMRERNFLLAEHADILISYVSNGRSGSAQTVRMADKMGKRIYNLYPALEKENDDE